MSIVQTVLVFVGIPLGITALIVLAVYGKSMVRQPNRYRPGKAWDYPPSWYVPHPDAVVHAAVPAAGSSSTTAVGGASGEW
ncbi:MAG: aa3-type cytochrome oxidase subunit CtaJ [Jatrophihabitans sp.]